MIRRAALALAVVVGLAATAFAAETPIPPAPTRWVTDQAGMLSGDTVTRLDGLLESYEHTSGHQVVVWIGTTLGDAPLEEWSARAFKAWGIGSKAQSDGVAIFVFATDHKLRIEVGYGLEDKLPDAYAARIVHDDMEPELRNGHPDTAISNGVAGVLQRLGGADATAPTVVHHAVHHGPGGAAIIIIVILGVGAFGAFAFAARNPRSRVWFILDILSMIIRSGGGGGGWGGGGWGGGGGGGGFSGGGGSSGGGGASGSW